MNLIKLMYPTYEEWLAIEQRGAASYHIKMTLSFVLIIASLYSLLYLYSVLLFQTPYFADSSTSFAKAMRGIDLSYMFLESYLSLIGVIIGGIMVSDSHWFKYKWFDKNGDATWPVNKKAGKTSKWFNRNGLVFWVFLAAFLFYTKYHALIMGDSPQLWGLVDMFIILAFITPGILLGAFFARKRAEIDARKFNIESKQITVWPYSIPFLITLCILVAAALGHPI